ncbi:HAD-IC family P-type ATPase [Amycolatopsis pigmentata]|uniref:HAD-IC family P-type ATPase n=1 Tax=Amycolatopsis pigmentata TaxID=450801 RepID=A0ABW5FYS9_9PSEU
MRLLGVRVPGPVSVVKSLLSPLMTSAERHVWSCEGRLHIEAHGVSGPGGEAVAERIERELENHPGVKWARVNAPASRVIIEVGEPAPRPAELVETVKRAEAEPAPEELEKHHPADGMRGTRLVQTLAADALGIGLSVITRLAPWAPLPPEIAALPGLLDMHPKLRELAAGRAGGHERADSATSIAAALAQGLATGSDGSLLDATQRIEQWRETKAHEKAWCALESELIDGPDSAGAPPVITERPRPVPEGPVETYQRRVMKLGAAATAVALPFGPRRAMGVGLAAQPKAAEAGRAAFGAHLGRVLASQGALVMDRAILRGLDTVDVVVIDEGSIGEARPELDELIPAEGADPHEVAAWAWRLFDASRTGEVRESDGWRMGPLGEIHATGEVPRREEGMLGLARGDALQAVLTVRRRTPAEIGTLVAAARAAEVTVIGANDGEPSFEADRVVPGGARLTASVRDLQAEGHVVLLVSGDRRALGAADCGVGTHRDGEAPPWGAHVLVRDDLSVAALLVRSVGVARDVTRESIRLAQGTSGVAALSALQAGRTSPASRGLRVVNAGAAVALANAHRRARSLRTPKPATEPPPWHLMPVDVVLTRLRADRDGLTSPEAGRRRREEKPDSATGFTAAFLAELANPLTPVLLGGAALSASVGSPVDAALVAGVTALSALVGSVQQVYTERELAALLNRSAVSATVRRDGEERVVNADELVRGDVVVLTAGDVVPADCRVLEARGLEADESSLTGESLPVAKDSPPVIATDVADRTSMLYEGTTVAAGHAVALVVATGTETEAGRGMAIARENAPVTGVESRLTELTRKSMPLAVGSAVAVVGAGLVRRVPVRESLSAAVNLAVASVPEGLPFLVNAAQLAAARRLAAHNALVRNPRSIEALGRVDVLCFDKTGTLTEGKLAVKEVDDGRRRHPIGKLGGRSRAVLTAALRATPHADDPAEVPHATDQAILEAGQEAGVRTDWKEVQSIPFEPSRGYHATVGTVADGRPVLSVKGAPEAVLPRCALDEAERTRLSLRMKRLASSGRRVLAVAEGHPRDRQVDEEAVADLEFLGFVAIADPVRGSAAPAAAKLREAGVHIVMITGDHPETGKAIAGEVGPDDGEPHVVTGAELDAMDEERLEETLRTVDVVARCSPAQKVRIIKAYQRQGRTVAMTGDGANDAPAIRLADVGIALGGHGSPAAKAAADLVVTDDRLETIIAALVEGRAMWASVRKALGILLGGNLGEIGFSVLGSVLTGRSPLTARQLLLVNLLTDLAPALAIALRKPGGTPLGEGPERSLGKSLDTEIGVRAGVTTLGATAAWSLARFTGRRRRASTVALAGLVGTQLGQTVLAGADRTTAVTALGSAAALALVIQTPGVSRFFGCTPLGPVGWSMALGSAAGATLFGGLLESRTGNQEQPEGA